MKVIDRTWWRLLIVPDEGYWSYLMKVIPETVRVHYSTSLILVLDYSVNNYHENEASFHIVLNIDDIKFVQIEQIN